MVPDHDDTVAAIHALVHSRDFQREPELAAQVGGRGRVRPAHEHPVEDVLPELLLQMVGQARQVLQPRLHFASRLEDHGGGELTTRPDILRLHDFTWGDALAVRPGGDHLNPRVFGGPENEDLSPTQQRVDFRGLGVRLSDVEDLLIAGRVNGAFERGVRVVLDLVPDRVVGHDDERVGFSHGGGKVACRQANDAHDPGRQKCGPHARMAGFVSRVHHRVSVGEVVRRGTDCQTTPARRGSATASGSGVRTFPNPEGRRAVARCI